MTEPSTSVTERTAAVTGQRRVNEVLAWAGIAAATVFIVAVVFFSGFFIGRSTGGCDRYDHWNEMPGPEMPGPGMMGPGMMGPGMGPQTCPTRQWDPGQTQAPTATPTSMPRP